MKTFVTVLLAVLLFAPGAFAQEDEDWASRDYSIDDFSELYLYGGYKVFLSQGKKTALTIKSSDEDVLDNLKVNNRGDELRIEMKEDYITYRRIRVYLTFRNLEEIEVQGGLKLESDGYLDLKDLFISVEGGAKVDLQLKADDVEVRGEGGVLVDLEGVANSLEVRLSGAGHVDADELKTKDSHIEIEGVGTASVYATEKLFAKIDGVGKVSYKGDPKVTEDINGLGSVSKN
ncbi:head GIN domain-containing protein [Maribellus sediminis]|uniref:head GIN domain-containing protein n=1 Tax=Maribellus sediminis TaxID=2696285 RepID=UPI00142F51F1|nr:head GIN domain-containing protein [Maribellus sediminis]